MMGRLDRRLDYTDGISVFLFVTVLLLPYSEWETESDFLMIQFLVFSVTTSYLHGRRLFSACLFTPVFGAQY
jgi:hypothetical protein